MAKTISILGCGWLGFPLGTHLLTKGYRVKGSVTSRSKIGVLARSGIEPYRVLLKPEQALVSDERFFDADVLMIAIPPRRVEFIEAIFSGQLKQVIPFIIKHGIKKVLLISSTSVYNETYQVVREQDTSLPDKASGRAMLIAENMLQESAEFKTTVVRFGGLIGYDRNPARFLLRKKGDISGLTPVNLIHQDDCISILSKLIEDNIWGETFNACCPKHPTRKEFYKKAAEVSHLPVPEMNEKIAAYKVVDSSKLIQTLRYKFKYQNPLDYLIELGLGVG